MSKLDYYKILGISKNAEEREIKKAYKRLAMKFHPDRNPNNSEAESKFKEIKEAYEILIDPKKRTTYDQYGHAAFEQNHDANNFNNTEFSDIFSDVFGDMFSHNKNKNFNDGTDLCYNIELSLEDVLSNTTHEIRIPKFEKCSYCKGSGAKPGTSMSICSTCNGQGQIHMRQGFFTIQQTCPTCKGQRKIIRNICNKCQGQGKTKKNKTLSINIPAGVNTGDRIRLSGEGEIGNNGYSGDLYIQISIRKHDIFIRKDNDLYCEIPISFTIAALGGEIEVPTLVNKIKLKIPEETQTGRLFRIRGKGIKSINNKQGDLLCKVLIETPIKLNDYQKTLLYKLEESFINTNNYVNNPIAQKFFKKCK